MYPWVLQQNTAAQQFYRARGATCVETATVSPPGGNPARLKGTPGKLRMAWPEIGSLQAQARASLGADQAACVGPT
jgi:hypothetical protein